jgi:predicted Zn-dependent protease
MSRRLLPRQRETEEDRPAIAFEPVADDSWPVELAAANAASDARDWPRAVAAWETLREKNPEEALCWLKAGEAYLHAGQVKRAETIFDEAARRFPDDFWIA